MNFQFLMFAENQILQMYGFRIQFFIKNERKTKQSHQILSEKFELIITFTVFEKRKFQNSERLLNCEKYFSLLSRKKNPEIFLLKIP